MKALFNRRNAINMSLIVTLGLGPALSYLQASDAASGRSSDLVLKSLQAKKSGNMAQYQAYLAQAKQNLSTSENMSAQSQRTASLMIDQMISNPQMISGPASGQADADLVRDNPEAREVLYNMAVGRMQNAADMMNTLTTDVAGVTGTVFDQQEANAAMLDQLNPTTDLVGKVLTLLGVMKIDPKVDLSIIKRNDPGYNPDVVANDLINKSAKTALMIGAIPSSGIENKYIAAAGLTFKGYLLLKQNTQMMQDIAALYGQPIRDATAFEAFAASVFYIAQLYSTLNGSTLSNGQLQAAAEQVGGNFALLKVPAFASRARLFFSQLLHSPKAQQLLAAGRQGAKNVADQSGIPSDPGVPAPAPAPGAPAPAPTSGSAASSFPHRAGLQTVLTVGLMSVRDSLAAGAMTKAIGIASVHVARAAAKKSQQQRDQAFYKFMGSSTGEQFVNLLLTASQASNHPIRDTNIETSRDSRMIFIHNVAKMAHLCSAADIDSANARARALGTAAAKDIAVYDCASRTSVEPYNRLRSNFLNFKGIMTDENAMTALRLTAKSNRLKMAQLVNQFQFLDGDRDPKEILYFATVRKLLGLDDPAFDEYFQQYDSHVSENHGPKPDAQSPTGFIVDGSSKAAPFSEKKAGIAPNDSVILDSDLLVSGQTQTTNTNTSNGSGTGWPPSNVQTGNWPPLTPVPDQSGTCNPNVPGSCNNPNNGNVPAPNATRSWLHIENLQGV